MFVSYARLRQSKQDPLSFLISWCYFHEFTTAKLGLVHFCTYKLDPWHLSSGANRTTLYFLIPSVEKLVHMGDGLFWENLNNQLRIYITEKKIMRSIFFYFFFSACIMDGIIARSLCGPAKHAQRPGHNQHATCVDIRLKKITPTNCFDFHMNNTIAFWVIRGWNFMKYPAFV